MARSQLLCLLAVCVLARTALSERETVKIGVKHRPESCDVKAKNGDYVGVHYSGKLTDGTEFDNSFNRGEPIEFQLGTGQVIAGWEQGILGMCVGEKRKLQIPPSLGYGEDGMGPIPGGSTLVFDVELMSISDTPAHPADGGYPPYGEYEVNAGDSYQADGEDQMLGEFDLSGMHAGYGDEDAGEAQWS